MLLISDEEKELAGMENMACSSVEVDELVIDIDISQNVEPPLWPECCIYKVPKKLRHVTDVSEEAYTPKVVSIGPFHYNLEVSRGMEMQKLNYVKEFCARTRKSQKDLVSIIAKTEEDIRRCYSETFKEINQNTFVKIILFDAIFIIELFLRNFENKHDKEHKKHDYILTNAWLESHVKQDLILLENQLPFKFLKKFYKDAFDGEEDTPLLKLACEFFFSGKHRIPLDKEVKHFTDLQRIFYSPKFPKPDPEPSKNLNQKPKPRPKNLRYTATKLYEIGWEFEAGVDRDPSDLLNIDIAKNECLDRYPSLNLSWLFSCLPCLKNLQCSKSVRCILKVPQLVIDEKTEALFRNLMALEQCHYPSDTYICNYVLLMDCLISTKEDVCLLVEKKVIVNRRGSSKAITTLINTLGHEIVERESCYHELYRRLNEHCDSKWNRLLASLTSVYFKDFWRGTATIAGILVLCFAFVNFLRPFVMKK
jgi:hypothetical protein